MLFFLILSNLKTTSFPQLYLYLCVYAHRNTCMCRGILIPNWYHFFDSNSENACTAFLARTHKAKRKRYVTQGEILAVTMTTGSVAGKNSLSGFISCAVNRKILKAEYDSIALYETYRRITISLKCTNKHSFYFISNTEMEFQVTH